LIKPLILVTGATGYIASRLIPRLLDSDYRVRALARDPLRLSARSWFNKIDIVQADVTAPDSLARALAGVDTAYYLIHNMSHGRGYTSLELDAARNFARAAEATGVKHIIYLGGLADPEQHIAPHMRSRIETGRVLREGKVPVTEFRAGVIAGSGSISFEMIRFMTELFPVVPGPLWMKNKSQPIAIQNVIDYLFAALENKNGQGQVFEIGGPEATLYQDLMLRYARARGLKRYMVLLPGIPIWFMAFGVGLMTPVPYPIAYALIGGLSADSLVKHAEALHVFPEVQLVSFDAAARDALEKTHPTHIEPVWETGTASALKHEGCFIDHRVAPTALPPEAVLRRIRQLAEARGWQAQVDETGLRVLVTQARPVGGQWLAWRIEKDRLAQTFFFAPRGLPGFLYWYALAPLHKLQLRRLLHDITHQLAG
jgi:uncharacterized protein YbjT (DUF2867 family)